MRRNTYIAIFGLVLLSVSAMNSTAQVRKCRCTLPAIDAAIECTTFRRP